VFDPIRLRTLLVLLGVAPANALAFGGSDIAPAARTRAGAPVIETVAVGNPGNPGEQSRLPFGDPTFYGGVAYSYAIGIHEVTAAQYTAFLNAVAATDVYGLYHTRMDYDADPSREGCNIKRLGSAGSYTYSVAPDWADRPVNYVSWADAARFANWLHNGQPTGAQDLTTTEDGSYFLNGIFESRDDLLEEVVREPDATWVIPSEDEWYKAAYHKNDGATANYWNLPTGADNGVSNQLIDPDPGNNATFSVNQVRTIGPPYDRTQAGAHENSASPYGTFDQGGNVMEFTEAVPVSDIRRIRGGSWFWGSSLLYSSEVDDVMHSSDQFDDLGFRVVMLGTDPVSVPPGGARASLRFGIGGPHPFHEEASVSIVLPEAARVHIEVFDLSGRRLPGSIEAALPAGTNELKWSVSRLAAGVYLARLSTIGQSRVIRFVRLR
jgi:formylglycine-generating enzyme required for sulfatase activity